jgi:hypothetical protein
MHQVYRAMHPLHMIYNRSLLACSLLTPPLSSRYLLQQCSTTASALQPASLLPTRHLARTAQICLDRLRCLLEGLIDMVVNGYLSLTPSTPSGRTGTSVIRVNCAREC